MFVCVYTHTCISLCQLCHMSFVEFVFIITLSPKHTPIYIFIRDEYTCIYTHARASIFIRICIFAGPEYAYMYMRVCHMNMTRFTINSLFFLIFFFFRFSLSLSLSFLLIFLHSFHSRFRLKRNRFARTCDKVLQTRARALTLARRSPMPSEIEAYSTYSWA